MLSLQVPTQEQKLNIIRVRSPHFSKVSMCVELTSTMTAGDIVAKFRKKSFENMASKGVGPKQHPVVPRRMSFGSAMSGSSLVQPLDNHHLFEVGGNIGKSCVQCSVVTGDTIGVGWGWVRGDGLRGRGGREEGERGRG